MRWRRQDDWVQPAHRSHEAIVSDELAAAVKRRIDCRRGPNRIAPRESLHAYSLRGMLFCSNCGRKMQGAARVGKTSTRILYRCEIGKARSVARELADHPATVYINEADILPTLDRWIAALARSEDLAAAQNADASAVARTSALRAELAAKEKAVHALVQALEGGVAIEDISVALRQRTAERDELRARLDRDKGPSALTATQIQQMLDALGGMAEVLQGAPAAERAAIYATLGLRIDYDANERRVTASADLSRVAGRVRGGT
jgi:site-specific DNA recombinase